VISHGHGVAKTVEGHTTYQLTVHYTAESLGTYPSQTFAWDSSTGQWHEESFYDALNEEHIPRDVSIHVECWGRHFCVFSALVIDEINYAPLAIFEESLDFYTDEVLWFTLPARAPKKRIRRERIAPYLNQENRELYFPRFELEMDRGVGNESVVNPEMLLSWSEDGGRTFTNESPRHLGVEGDYSGRVEWWRLGRSRDRVFRVATESPCKIAITNCILDTPQVGGR
jgi:hypothetical protein